MLGNQLHFCIHNIARKITLKLKDSRAALDLAIVRKEWKELEDKEPYKKDAYEETNILPP